LDKALYDDLSLFGGFVTSSKLSGKKSKKQPENSGNEQLLSGCGFVQNIEPPSLSRDRRIKIEQMNKKRY